MSDTPNAPVEETPQQVPGTPSTPPSEDYKKRFDGAIRKIEELTLSSREKDAELAKKASEIEQLQAQLGLKDVEKTTAVGERDKQLQEYVSKTQQYEDEIRALKALQLKVKVARKLNRPELLRILDNIPALEDEETLETVMKDFLGFADELVSTREKQLMAGITPGAGGTAAQNANTPASEEGWEKHINSLPLGSKERADALNNYGDWLETKHK